MAATRFTMRTPGVISRGPFNIVIRNYWPKEEALNGTYKNPPIKKGG